MLHNRIGFNTDMGLEHLLQYESYNALAKPMQIYTALDPDADQTLPSKNNYNLKISAFP